MAAPPVRVLFMGTPTFAVPSLEALGRLPALCQVVGVMTQPDRPSGRGRNLAASAVKMAALGLQIAVLQPTRVRTSETLAALAALRPELLVVAAYGRILPPQVLALPPLGCINVHASLLPRYRGASPIARAIWAGDAEAGVCIMGMEAGMDTGPVFARAALPILDTATCGSLTYDLAHLGAQCLTQVLPGIIAGEVTPVPQPIIGVTHAPPLHKEDGLLDFGLPAVTLSRQVRALDPWPGTYAFFEGERVGLLEVAAWPPGAGAPEGLGAEAALVGSVLRADRTGLYIACGSGTLRVVRVKPAGRGPMDAGAWISGRGPRAGAQLTSTP